jgi:Transposase, Mutator family
MIGFAAQRLMELESEALYDARHGERSAERRNQRNGYRDRDWKTRARTVELRIPKLRPAANSRLSSNLAMAGNSGSTIPSPGSFQLELRLLACVNHPIEFRP